MIVSITDLFFGIIIIAIIAILIGIVISYLQTKFINNDDPINNAILEVNKLLPQTQCAQCDYPGCMPYATAIIKDNAPINKCIPGGQETIKELAKLLNTEEIPLNTTNKTIYEKPMVVKIIEESCIGCTKCINACPVDAIIGAPKQMHAVIAEYCTGCMLCIPPCPMDCIEIIERPVTFKVS